MNEFIQKLKSYVEEAPLSFNRLNDFLLAYDYSSLTYKDLIPEPISGDYSRNILMLDPIEVVLIYWPSGVESAIHFHEGFYGHVVVLEGSLMNIEYQMQNGSLRESMQVEARPYGVLPERENIIHKLVNDHSESAVTLHTYYPPLADFNGMEIYDIKTNRLGILNEKAVAASWKSPAEHFHKIEENAFTYVGDASKKSHRIHPLIPKPSKVVILDHITAYYQEQAEQYDSFDLTHKSRSKYVSKINDLVAEQATNVRCEHLLHLACGTGRRGDEIRRKSGRDYAVTAVDVSASMVAQAEKYGFDCHVGDVQDMQFDDDSYELATMLYAFGHLVSEADRKAVLTKVHQWLKPGGLFVFDVFNLRNKNEWGPSALQVYHLLSLDKFGYEKGDVFYKKKGGKEVAYLHYFERDEIEQLMQASGFKIKSMVQVGYAVDSGQLVDGENQGSFFVVAQKV